MYSDDQMFLIALEYVRAKKNLKAAVRKLQTECKDFFGASLCYQTVWIMTKQPRFENLVSRIEECSDWN